MIMPWFLPLALGIGILGTMGARDYRKLHDHSRKSRDAWLLILFAWLPLAVWLANLLWPQH